MIDFHGFGPIKWNWYQELSGGAWPMNISRLMIIIGINGLLIVELFISMYFAGQDPANLNSIFFKWFLSMAIPTLLIGRKLKKHFRSTEPEIAA